MKFSLFTLLLITVFISKGSDLPPSRFTIKLNPTYTGIINENYQGNMFGYGGSLYWGIKKKGKAEYGFHLGGDMTNSSSVDIDFPGFNLNNDADTSYFKGNYSMSVLNVNLGIRTMFPYQARRLLVFGVLRLGTAINSVSENSAPVYDSSMYSLDNIFEEDRVHIHPYVGLTLNTEFLLTNYLSVYFDATVDFSANALWQEEELPYPAYGSLRLGVNIKLFCIESYPNCY